MDRGEENTATSGVGEEHHQSANSDEIIRHLEIDEDYGSSSNINKSAITATTTTVSDQSPEVKVCDVGAMMTAKSAVELYDDEDKDYDSYGDEDDNEADNGARPDEESKTTTVKKPSEEEEESAKKTQNNEDEAMLDEEEGHDFEYDTATEFVQSATKVASTSTITSASTSTTDTLAKEKDEDENNDNVVMASASNESNNEEKRGCDANKVVVESELEEDDDDDDDEFANSKKLKIDEEEEEEVVAGETGVDRSVKSDATSSSSSSTAQVDTKSEDQVMAVPATAAESKPKVPPLKIIISTSSAGDGLPYVKASPTSSEATDSLSTIGGGQQTTTPTNKSNTLKQTTTRSAAAKAASSARAPSPVLNPKNKTRSSVPPPSQSLTSGGRVSPTKQPTSSSSSSTISASTSSSLLVADAPASTSTTTTVNEKEQKRKLRSHTRGQQNQHYDSNSKSSPSTSPLTVTTTATTATAQDNNSSSSNSSSSSSGSASNEATAVVVGDHQHQLEDNSTDGDNETATATAAAAATSRQGITTRKRRYNNTPVNTTGSKSSSSNVESKTSENSENTEVSVVSPKETIGGEVVGSEQSTSGVDNETTTTTSPNGGTTTTKTDSSDGQTDENQESDAMVIDSAMADSNTTATAVLAESLEATSISLANTVTAADSSSTTAPVAFDSSNNTTNNQAVVVNCTRKYLDIRNEILKKQSSLMEKKPELKLPSNLNEFLLFKKSYLIRTNRDVKQTIPFYKPPSDLLLSEELKEHFLAQEKERYEVRIRHRVEQDKLGILYEQEVLRCHTRLATQTSQQVGGPFSFCSIIKDDEVYFEQKPSQQQQQQQQTIDTESAEFLESCKEKFIASLNQVKSKFQKLKDDLIKRQLNESDSLYAVQKMDFQSKLRELKETSKSKNGGPVGSGAATTSTTTSSTATNIVYSDSHVPIVSVNSKLELVDVYY